MPSPDDENGADDLQAMLSPQVLARITAPNQLEFELGFFRGMLERDPNYGEVLRVMANNLTAKGDLDGALQFDLRLSRLFPTDPCAFYNLACTYSLLGAVDLGLEALEKAVLLGYDDLAYLEEDRDLEALRKESRFLDLLEAVQLTRE